MASSCNVIVQTGKGVLDNALGAAAALSPGHLIERTSSSTYQKHSTAAGNAIPCVALDQRELNKGTTDAYAQNDKVKAYFPERGSQVYLRVAAGCASIAQGAFVESAGDGTVRTLSGSNPETIVAQANEAVDNSGGASEVFILVTIK